MSKWARTVCLLLVIAALQVLPVQIAAQQRGPSTPEERARTVQTAKSLQADPLAPSLQGDREWLVERLVVIPCITVKMSTSFLGRLGVSNSGDAGSIIA